VTRRSGATARGGPLGPAGGVPWRRGLPHPSPDRSLRFDVRSGCEFHPEPQPGDRDRRADRGRVERLAWRSGWILRTGQSLNSQCRCLGARFRYESTRSVQVRPVVAVYEIKECH
jgi:hypothetical protein